MIPADMKVPIMRRDLSNIDNVRWLLRNIAISNGQHRLILPTINALREMLK